MVLGRAPQSAQPSEAQPRILLTVAPAPPGHIVLFWPPAILLLAIACIGAERWRAWYALMPDAARAVLAPPSWLPDPLAAIEASLFLAGLVAIVGRNFDLFRRVWRALRSDDFHHALYAVAALEALTFVTRASSLGFDYQRLSLGPFGQETGILSRRILEVALSYFTHLNGALFILFHFLAVFMLLTLSRAYLRRRDAAVTFLPFLSIATCSFAIFQFQYPGYPDVLALSLVLCAVLAELGIEALLAIIVLALLTHEALAAALLLPLLAPLPRRFWPILALPFALYFLLWAADFGFDFGAAWRAQMHYQGLSGPEAVATRPGTVLFGILAANKLLLLAIAAQLVYVARGFGAAAAARLAAPLAAVAVMCVLSYDTSRMVEVGFLTLLVSWSGCLRRWPPRFATAIAIANLLLPSLYVSPYFSRPLGIIWPPGLYSTYHLFRADTD